jgi:hypothetical protein
MIAVVEFGFTVRAPVKSGPASGAPMTYPGPYPAPYPAFGDCVT